MFDIFAHSSRTTPLRVLALSPHTDDYELGCGGTIARLLDSGASVNTIVFSTCDERVSEQYPPDILRHEFENACGVMGLDDTWARTVFKYPVDMLQEYRQDILEYLVTVRSGWAPHIVFCPCSQDVHQDHRVIYEEAVRAFKWNVVLGYQDPWNCVDLVQKDVIVRLNAAYVDKKISVLAEYKSQAHRPYFKTDFLWSWARVNGVVGGTEFAEIFECIRWVV